MLVTFPSAALFGVDAYRVDVEVDVGGGLPQYVVVGLPTTSVKEGASRIRSALKNCGHAMPSGKVTVNLAPADRRKDGAAFDLPIAVGVLAADGGRPIHVVDGLLMMGELGLDGSLRPVPGVLAACMMARDFRLRGVIVPAGCAAEATMVEDLEVYGVSHLSEVIAALVDGAPLPRARRGLVLPPARPDKDFAEVRGQDPARKAVEIAAAGGHNVLLYGAPGVGKTMIAQRVPSILPPMRHEETLEVTRIYSAVGLAPPSGLMLSRPFRAPHHTISAAALAGGGTIPKPGEITLAHRGVLFLDELPEFARGAVEVLRQPLEERRVRVARVHATVVMPASFTLVAAANPCPCGWHGNDARTCKCSPTTIERYRGRMSGPLLDRIDLQVRVEVVRLEDLRGPTDGESSAAIHARVAEARDRQLARAGALNGELDSRAARATFRVTAEAEAVLAKLPKRRAMSARAVDRLVRVSRTIADLAGDDTTDRAHVLEAAAYRALESEPIKQPRAIGPWTPAEQPEEEMRTS